MKTFKDIYLENNFNKPIEFPTVSLTNSGHTLTIRFDSKDTIVGAGYSGPSNPWISSLCYLIEGKSLKELTHFNLKNWKNVFENDQSFWDFLHEEDNHYFSKALELLNASLNIYRGREYLYKTNGAIVCRCFGTKEEDILDHLQKESTPTLETLAEVYKAGMGCRSCVPQLKRWLVFHESKKHSRYYKERPIADWLLEIDYMLSCFPKSADWKMEVSSFKANQVIISFEKEVSQSEEEHVGKELQDFLGASLDGDLGFFLRRARHFSKAKG